jgi:hypothetical protein
VTRRCPGFPRPVPGLTRAGGGWVGNLPGVVKVPASQTGDRSRIAISLCPVPGHPKPGEKSEWPLGRDA